MPRVGRKTYPYSAKGKLDAKREAVRVGKKSLTGRKKRKAKKK